MVSFKTRRGCYAKITFVGRGPQPVSTCASGYTNKVFISSKPFFFHIFIFSVMCLNFRLFSIFLNVEKTQQNLMEPFTA